MAQIKKQYRLAANDEWINRSTHIGIVDFIKQFNESDIIVGSDTAVELRKKTYHNAMALYKKYGGNNFADFWNLHVQDFTTLQLNEFAKIPAFKPFCEYIECFEKKSVIQEKGKVTANFYFYSFGLSKEILKKYFEEYDKAKKENKEFIQPSLPRKYNARKRSNLLYKVYNVKDKQGINFAPVERDALFSQFSDWCTINEMSLTNGIKEAIKLLLQTHPVEQLKNIEDYIVKTELDEVYYTRPAVRKDTGLFVKIEKSLFNKMEEIIKRYNDDPLNIVPLTKTDYIHSAIFNYNRKVNLKYSDNEKYQLLKASEKIESGDT